MDESRISPSADPLADVAPEHRNVFDPERIERAIREILVAIGEDPDRDGLRDTPQRVARAYKELFSGLYQKPDDVFATTFDLNHHELIVVKDISIFSVCEHHLLPFYGTASVGYIPNESGRITGLSKLARLVDVYAKRPQVQERLTSQVADSMMRILEPRGVIVGIECEHMCMSMRGVGKQSAKTLTTATRGILDDSELKQLTLKFVSRD